MAAVVNNIYIEQGATFQLNLLWKDSAGAPINLTGYTARMQVRHKINDPTALLSLTTENSGIALGGAAGTINIVATAALTTTLTEKSGVYDLELVASNGVVTRLLQGVVTISPEVTR